jgi:hypothetical protein
VVTALLGQIEASIPAERTYPMIGASMGGLLGRAALAQLEWSGTGHRVETYISFDAPQTGAVIPLGVQYWLQFFADQSADAADLLAALDRPAALEMLLYHHEDPPAASPGPDPLRGEFLTWLDSVGGWPSAPRLVSVANGSGSGANQGFAPGDQIISWEYSSFLVDIIGNAWALPDGGPGVVFDGEIDIILLPTDQLTVTVSGTAPWDGAPGGWRSSLAQMDSTEAPYGDIVALHPSHCFIPTVSALALDTTDPFYDVDGDPDLLSHTPFDAVYYPVENQEHVSITAESAEWLVTEITSGLTAVAAGPAEAGPAVRPTVFPNPFNPTTTFRFAVPDPGPVRLEVFDPAGRRVATLVDTPLPAGTHTVRWEAADAASGVYLYRLAMSGREQAGKLTLVR